jgi:hypothetical protein
MDMSWVDAFQENFGLEIDPNIYNVQKRARQGVVQESPIKHDLREQVDCFICKFYFTGMIIFLLMIYLNSGQMSGWRIPKSASNFHHLLNSQFEEVTWQ